MRLKSWRNTFEITYGMQTLHRAEGFRQICGGGILTATPGWVYDLYKADNPKRICGNFAELPHPVMPVVLCCWGTCEMGLAMLNWALTSPAGNYLIPIADTDSAAPGDYSFWAYSSGTELRCPFLKAAVDGVLPTLPASSQPPASARLHQGHPRAEFTEPLPSCFHSCCSASPHTDVQEKLHKLLVLEPEENTQSQSHFSHWLEVKPLYLLAKTLHSMWQ